MGNGPFSSSFIIKGWLDNTLKLNFGAYRNVTSSHRPFCNNTEDLYIDLVPLRRDTNILAGYKTVENQTLFKG